MIPSKSADHLYFFIDNEELYEAYTTIREPHKTRYVMDVPGFEDEELCDEQELNNKLTAAGHLDID